jgi:hypothetical protein
MICCTSYSRLSIVESHTNQTSGPRSASASPWCSLSMVQAVASTIDRIIIIVIIIIISSSSSNSNSINRQISS